MQDIDSINCPIHSFETFGAVDGPGIRFVIFTQGCNLKCKYCQNRDTWDVNSGTIYDIDDVVKKIERYTAYMQADGGITVSGGEPLLQPDALITLFKEMKKTRNHIAVVLDEYGGTVGIVTIEDLIEEVFGDIEDEYDDENKEIEVIKEDEYIVDGSAKLDVVSELIGVNMESEEFDSVGGLIIGELGRFPEQDEEIVLNNIKFKVEEIDKNRVKKVRIFT